MALDIGIVLQTNPPASDVVDLAVRADGLGFSHVWTFDSHVLWRDPYPLLTLMGAACTSAGDGVPDDGVTDECVTACESMLGDCNAGDSDALMALYADDAELAQRGATEANPEAPDKPNE